MSDTFAIILVLAAGIGAVVGAAYLLSKPGKGPRSTGPTSGPDRNELTLDPRPYQEWRTEAYARKEDAAYSLAYYVIEHCREETIEKASKRKDAQAKQMAADAVDLALHSFFDLAEGFYPMPSGMENDLELVLTVRVKDKSSTTVEEIEISPNEIDLPVGYWKWAHEKSFRSSD